MSEFISPLATVDPAATIADSVEIGPNCVIGPDVEIGPGTRLAANVVIRGRVKIGRYNMFHPGCVIGGEPQDLGYREEPTTVTIGDHNIIREGVTINRGTAKDVGNTSLGSHCYLMACAHIAHDCQVGDHVVMANGSMLGGHCKVHDYASLSGLVAAHHYVTIGSYAFVGGMSRVISDVPPYMLCEGQPARPRCPNVVALKRRNFDPEVVSALSDAHRLLYRRRVGLEQAREILSSDGKLFSDVVKLLEFVDNANRGRFGRSLQKRAA